MRTTCDPTIGTSNTRNEPRQAASTTTSGVCGTTIDVVGSVVRQPGPPGRSQTSEVTVTDLLSTDSARSHVEVGESAATSVSTRLVVDTSVLIADPHCIASFGSAALVIPLTVVEELDSLKTRPDDVGRSARAALRAIEDLRVQHGGSLAEPVAVGDGTV